MELLEHMAEANNLKVVAHGPVGEGKRTYTLAEQRLQAKWLAELPRGAVYIQHVNWINFTHFNLLKPIFINLVRDPVERMISWYFYVRGSYKNAIYYNKHPNHPIQSAEWFKKDFNKCVRSGDPECQYIPYTVEDKTGNHKRQSLFFCGHSQECL